MVKVHDRGKRAQSLIAAAAVAGVVVTSWDPARALELTLDLRTVTDAVLFGQSRVDTERRRFHEPYRLLVRSGEIDFIDVVTPYRRVVLAAEDRAAIGDRQFGQRQALALLDAAPQQVELHVELTFHPLNVYVGVPAYRVALVGPDRMRIEPRNVGLYSRYTPRISDRPSVTPLPAAPLPAGRSQPLIGGTMVAGFDGRALDPKGTYDAVISLDGKDVARARLELGKLR
jgi:hypothetical protein